MLFDEARSLQPSHSTRLGCAEQAVVAGEFARGACPHWESGAETLACTRYLALSGVLTSDHLRNLQPVQLRRWKVLGCSMLSNPQMVAARVYEEN